MNDMKLVAILLCVLLSSCRIDDGDENTMKTEAVKIAYDVVKTELISVASDVNLMQKIDIYLQAKTQYEKDSILYFVLKDYKILNKDSNIFVSSGEGFEYEITRKDFCSLSTPNATWVIRKNSLYSETRNSYIKNVNNKEWEYVSNDDYSEVSKFRVKQQITNNKLTDGAITNDYVIEQVILKKNSISSNDKSLKILYTIDKPIVICSSKLEYPYYERNIFKGKINMSIPYRNIWVDSEQLTEEEAIVEIISEEQTKLTFMGITEVWYYFQ